jgi:putative DNA primase/helicase
LIDFSSVNQPIELTEDGIAEEFGKIYQDRFRFDHDVGKWYEWNGKYWRPDRTQVVFHVIRHLIRSIRMGDQRLSTRRVAGAVESMARSDQLLAITSDQWNGDPFLLGTPEGIVDLRTGGSKDPCPEDYITVSTTTGPAQAGAPHPIFSKFLDEITNGDKELQAYLQLWCGYCLTGEVSEHALLFIYGPGGNGKSVFVNIVSDILGDYAKSAATDTFMAKKFETHSTDIAMLHGARMVSASETEKGSTWSDSKVNRLTGGDPITARFMRRDNFTFKPQFKLVMTGNYKPQLAGVNEAARRRIRIVPFLNKPAEPDHTLPQKLKAEAPAILRWMINGCLDWQAKGLCEPETVKCATAEYFAEQDVVARWIDDCCETGPHCKATASDLYVSWRTYLESIGEHPGSAKVFASELTQRGYQKKKSGSTVYMGIRLKMP